MSNPIAAIRAAFVTKLQAFPSLPSVAWENFAFTPVNGASYLKPALLPGEPSQAEIGVNGINRHVGVYQISVFAPSGSGIAAINTLVDSLCDHFKRGTVVAYTGTNVTISKAYAGPVLQETDWQQVPISILYRADVPN